jgi:hypothetical protein
MKIALITPASQLHHCMNRKFQMLIPGFEHNLEYKRYFKVFGTNNGNFVMLDNGAFEGSQLNDRDLLDMGREYKVDELCIPDTMGDSVGTLEQLGRFAAVLRHPSRGDTWKPPRLMAIVQGETEDELISCIDAFAADRFTNVIDTIGIPKHLPATTGWDDIRIRLAKWTQTKYPHKWDLHFLGFVAPGETMGAAQLGVRSMDTSAPFVCTADNVSISLHRVPPRQRWFANLGPEYFHPHLVRQNIDDLDLWAVKEDD